jgi:hypothetical protein
MDKTRFSRRRLIENELVLRHKNEVAKDALQKYYAEESDIDDVPLEFYCECSNDDCERRVELTMKQYERYHVRKDRFVVLRGHETESIEKIVRRFEDYIIVEKFDLPA